MVVCIGLLASPVVAPPAASANTSINIFGTDVQVLESSLGEDVLMINEEEWITDGIITLDKVDQIAGVNFLIGYAGPGGSGCDSAPFIVSFHKDSAPRLFGPLETCRAVTVSSEGDALRFVEFGAPGTTVKSWTWTPSGSLSESPHTHPMTEGMGWTSLWERKVDHPADLLGSEEIVADLRKLTGDKWERARDLMSGVGSVEFKGDVLIGTTCAPRMCGIIEQFVALDMQARKAFVAIKEKGQDIIVFPAVKEWPATPKLELARWAKPWFRGDKK